ncbi:taurine catabolism dioxygenase [Geodermatophilus sp. Leaf369]|uniref:TauD/TfdA dioxygenase family protein n=1 Tax=Geodermatophilus sp. Leaf369 TaxID=1736354 RepID=UPI0006FCE678|nr:TauD/TfdA family dioxygenase [Geodermatophilus sp. Leaf369]KQS60747.1 taurine catabolism dioxygenase [Geodermatophilus sp. Leaf369]
MHTTTLQPLGAELTDTDIAALTDEQIGEVRSLLAEHGVVVFRDQHVDDDAFLAFLQRFGPLTFTAGETPVDGFPDLNVISNVGRTEPPRSTFHVDSSYLSTPPAYTALRAVEIPSQGGETVFTNQYRAYETLGDDVKARLEGATITHVVTGIDPSLLTEDDETQAEHPVFRPHPLSGRTALYMSTPKRCAAVSGLDDAAAAEVVAELYAHSTTEENSHAHRWAPGDVVMWDNGCVLHRGDHSVVVGDRVMHRGMVADYGLDR